MNDASMKADKRTEFIPRNALDGTPINRGDAEHRLSLPEDRDTEENPPLAEAARAVNARLRAVVASVQFTGMADTPKPLAN
jgi:hypothetical protein